MCEAETYIGGNGELAMFFLKLTCSTSEKSLQFNAIDIDIAIFEITDIMAKLHRGCARCQRSWPRRPPGSSRSSQTSGIQVWFQRKAITKKQYKLQQQLKTETKGKYIYTTFVSKGIAQLAIG